MTYKPVHLPYLLLLFNRYIIMLHVCIFAQQVQSISHMSKFTCITQCAHTPVSTQAYSYITRGTCMNNKRGEKTHQ